MKFHTWHSPTSSLPEQGRAIVWKGMHGQDVHGCVSYKKKRRCFGPDDMIAEWLPLLTDRFHTEDVPIRYLPSLWRYVDEGSKSRYSEAVLANAE